MVTPSRKRILERARILAHEQQFKAGLPAITPEDYELKESGLFHKAKIELMSTRPDENVFGPPMQKIHAQMRSYVDDMAGELKLKPIPIRDLLTLKKETGWEWTNGWTKHEKRVPKAKPQPKPPKRKVRVPKRKPKKLHVQRNGKTMRRLRKRVKDGQKVFSFPDHVWKVRK